MEPTEINKKKSTPYDEINMTATRVVPEGFTHYDKVVIKEGSLTIE